MARVRMITRTVDVTTVKVMAVNVATKEVSTIEQTVYSMKDATDAEIMKEVKVYIPADFIPVTIESRETKEIIYGMTEKEFLESAKVIER